ncbi:MAG TPA: fibronectin type III domain-containing protein [Solirubrobacterales bacterium]|jgi:hypothetical protein
MRRLLSDSIAGVAIFALLAMVATGTAVAYFTTTGVGDSAPKGISQLAKPTLTATAQAGGAVILSWDAVTAPGPGAVTYSVSRDGKGAGASCSSSLVVTTCTDSGLEPGTYSYIVTAKWRSWSVISSAKAATITVGPAHHLVLGAVSLTPAAGAADNLTITAKDAKGSTVTTYAGSHNLTFSGATASPNGTAPTVADSSGAATAFGASTALSFSAGVATVTASTNGAMKLYASGKANLEASDGTISTVTPLAVTVAPATAGKFALTAATATPTAGEADNLTITALDPYGNFATGYTGSHSLTFSGATVIGTNKPTVSNSSGTAIAFGTATAITFTAGVATTSSSSNGAMTLYKAESPSIAVSDGTIASAAPAAVTVAPAAASKFALTAASTTPTAGEADNLTATAQDTYGNTATSYTGSHSVTFSGALAGPGGTVPTVSDSAGADVAFGSATTILFSAGVATATAGQNGAMKLYRSGSTSVKISDGALLTPTALVVTVAAASAAKFTLSASLTSMTAGGSSNITTTAFDSYGNVATGYAGSRSLTFSGATVIGSNKPTVSNSSGTATAFGTATAITFTAGVATVSSTKNGVMKLYDAEKASIGVSDGSISNEVPLVVTVGPAAAAKLVLAAAATATVAVASNSTTTAQDTYGNTATSYTGSRSITFSGAVAGPNGTLPTVSDSSGANIAFGTATPIEFSEGVASVSAGKNGAMKLYKSGATSIKASDGTFTTATVSVTVTAAAASKFGLAAATTTPVAAANDSLTMTAEDPYGNTATTYAGAHNLTFSGASASPSGTLPTVADSAGTAFNFGEATAIAFTSGVATVVSSTKNGAMKLTRAGAANITVSDGSISDPTPLAVTVSAGAAARWGLTSVSVSAGTLAPTCVFTCTLTGIGNSGTVTAKVAVTDSVGNTASAVGTGHAAKITTNGGGTIGGTPLAIPSTGAAESATTFTYTSKSSGAFSEIVTVAASTGTAYTPATLTASN